ncbi:MAG TPA: ribonuclease Y [Phycisphaerae bacterium]|jgi:ribonuclease Y|nr:ribonuclease Y [Phycisphaerae bacterium]
MIPFSFALAAIDPVGIGLGVAGLVVGFIAAFVILKNMAGSALKKAQADGEQTVAKAKSDAAEIIKKAEVDGKAEYLKIKETADKEVDTMRREMREQEQRLQKREDVLDRKLDTLGIKEKNLDNLQTSLNDRKKNVEAKEKQLDETLAQQKEMLLRITNMSMEEARQLVLSRVENEVRHDTALMVQKIEDQAKDEAKQKTMNIMLQAMQRYAAEVTSEGTTKSVEIPSDDMKGRIIGREGRNIRAFEQATGVDVIIDDTPGVITVNCFDPVRREVAKITMEKLIADGRIHPARIEEIVDLTQKEIENNIRNMGKKAVLECNIQGVHPKIVEMLGRLHYRTSYGQNVLRHSVEVAYLSQMIADELRLDGALARRAGLLHDIGKSMDHDQEGGHPAIGMEFCRKFNEPEAVLNAIGGHHNDIPATTYYTPIVMAADAISGARPGARRETLERYIKRLQELEGIATSMPGVKAAFAIQAGREVRVIVDPERCDDATAKLIARDIAKRIQAEMTYPGEIRVTVLREIRAVDFAR